MDAKADIKLSFTAEERVQVRNALLRYLTEHQIGVPTLWKNVIDNDPRKRFLNMRTLQRFVARAHQTQDSNVSICYEFVKNLPYFGEERPAAELGQALSRFYTPGKAPDAKGGWALNARIVLDARRRDLNDPVSGMSLVPKQLKTDDFPVYGVIVFDPSEDGSYYRIYQIINGTAASDEASAPMRLLASGVAVPVDGQNLITVEKDALTRRPRNGVWRYNERHYWKMDARYLMPEPLSGQSDPLHRESSLTITCRDGGPEAAAVVEKFMEANA